MKIALVAPIEETVPPTRYGGTEWIVYHLAHGLGLKHHEVDLYAPGDSLQESNYHLIPTIDKSIRTNELYKDLRKRNTIKFVTLADTVRLLNEKGYDIVHNHASWRLLAFSPLLKHTPVTTHHGPLNIPHETEVFEKYKSLPHVSISNNQRRDLPLLNFAATVYNGVDVLKFPFKAMQEAGRNAGMVFLARMSPEKGAIQAAEVARRTAIKLMVAAKVDTVDIPYFEEFKKAGPNEFTTFIGEIDHAKRLELLQNARCLIVPIQWEEPFGLMFTEAMACGTPVITYSRGSAPEIVEDGKTGFLVNQSEQFMRGSWNVQNTGIDGLCEAVERIYSLSDEDYAAMRKQCRARVEAMFTVDHMVDQYEAVYNQILTNKNTS